MKNNTDCRGEFIRPERKKLRLREYDYTLSGPYFVTVCTYNRRCLFEEELLRNSAASIIKTVAVDSSAGIHCFVIGVDHFHILLSMPEDRTTSLSKFMAMIKVRITQFFQKGRINPPLRIWQRSYYDHVIRNENDFRQIAEYIENHPFKEKSSVCAEWH